MTYRCVSRTMHARGSLRAFAPTPVLSERPTETSPLSLLKLLQKGSHHSPSGGSFRQSTFPRYPEFSIYRRKRFYNNAAMTISYSRRMIRNERTFTRGDVNVFVDDPIVGKLENLLGFFLRSEKQHCYYWRGIIVPEKQTSVALVWRRIMPP